MNEAKTVLFTSHHPALFADLQRQRPDVALMAIGSTIPPLDPASAIWCFVDFLLDDLSGIEMCRRLRNNPITQQSNITMVFDMLDAAMVTRAMNAGADDYAIAPLQTNDVIRRLDVKSMQAAAIAAKIELGGVVIEPLAHRVRYNGSRVDLAPNEFNLLLHLAQQPDRVLSRAEIIRLIGKPTEEIDNRTVDVWIGRLRRAFKTVGAPDIIRTVRPIGYMLETV